MSEKFLNKIGYKGPRDIPREDIVAPTADQVADDLERALQELAKGNTERAQAHISGALSQLTHVHSAAMMAVARASAKR